MIGDETIKKISVLAAVGFIAVVAIGVWLWLGTPGLPGPSPVATATPTVAVQKPMMGPTEAADLIPTPTAVITPRSVDDFGLPPGYQPTAGGQAAEEIPDLKKITPAPPPTETPQPQQPVGEAGGQPVEPGRVLEGVRQAVEQAKGLAERVTGPTPTPTPRGGILNTGIAAGIPGWVWIGVFILIAIIALVATGIIGIERE